MTPLPTITPLDQYENALIQYLKKTAGGESRLSDLLSIWAWRCGMEKEDIGVDHLATSMLDIVVRLNLMGWDGFPRLYHDAAPDRQWQFRLTDDTKLREPGFMMSHSEAVEAHAHLGAAHSRSLLSPASL